MRRSSALGTSVLAVLLVGAVVFFAVRNGQGSDAAGLVVTPSRVNWPAVPLGETREATLTIENRGKRQVMLGNPNPSCACIFVISRPTSLLGPGKKTTFRIGLDPSKTDPRPFHKKITIVSDDATTPSIDIPVDGEVYLYRRWTPENQSRDFHAVDPVKGAPPFVFQLRSGEGFAARAEAAESTDPRFSVEVVPADGGGSDIIVKPVVTTALGKGPVRAQITVKVVVTRSGLPPTTLMDVLTVAADLR